MVVVVVVVVVTVAIRNAGMVVSDGRDAVASVGVVVVLAGGGFVETGPRGRRAATRRLTAEPRGMVGRVRRAFRGGEAVVVMMMALVGDALKPIGAW